MQTRQRSKFMRRRPVLLLVIPSSVLASRSAWSWGLVRLCLYASFSYRHYLSLGLMGNIVDGIQRPLRVCPISIFPPVLLKSCFQSIQELSKSIYIPRGINTAALDRSLQWDYTPAEFRV